MKKKSLLLACLFVFVFGSARAEVKGSDAERVREAAHALVEHYDNDTGLFHGTDWWNAANGITALADASRALHTHEFDRIFANTLANAPKKFPGFLNEFYDDEGWWALAWIDVYELNHDVRYLKAAEDIFVDMTGGWGETCGGGIWWKKNVRYKNAIANELFLAVAAKLAALQTGNQRASSLQWAQREAKWFLQSGMINSDGLVNDGLDKECKNNGKTTWSYNQGVIVGGLVQLNKQTPNADYLAMANRIAVAATTKLVDGNGILHDPCEPGCGADGVQFKGIFVRNLRPLLIAEKSSEIAAFVRKNGDSVWLHARTPTNQFSCTWSGPPQDDKTGALISALDALTAKLNL